MCWQELMPRKKESYSFKKKKFAMALFGFTLGKISKTCQSKSVVIW